MAKIIRASKGSPQELEMLVENRIAELEDRDIAESTDIEAGRFSNRTIGMNWKNDLYLDVDGSIIGDGKTIHIDDLEAMYNDMHDYDPCVQEYDSFDDWLYDTVNNGYLKPVHASFVYPDDLKDLENGEYESHVTEPINCSAIVRPVGYKSWGVYLPDGHDHAEKLFESLSEDKCYEWIQKNEDIIQRLKSKFSSDEGLDDVEGASGSPQELQMLIENRLDNLESGVDASFVYPEDLIDLENGEYESHATEPVNASVGAIAGHAFKAIASDVLRYLADKGFDIASDAVRHYADKAANYIEKARQSTNYSIEEWYKDTKHDYPEDLRKLPKVNASMDPVNSVTFTGVELDPDEEELLYEIAERYNTSTPVSGDWATETEHEMHAIMDELDCDERVAKQIMQEYLGFSEDMFASSSIESAVSDEFIARYKPDADDIAEWLWEHTYAYDDVCRFFGCTGNDDLTDYASADELIDWIADHPQLAQDFAQRFGPEWFEVSFPVESGTNTANIMAGTDDDVAYAGPIIKAVDDIIWPNLSDRYTCINDVQAQLVPGELGDGNKLRVKISFVDDVDESDWDMDFELDVLQENTKTPSDAAYWIANALEDSFGDALDQIEEAYYNADWEM